MFDINAYVETAHTFHVLREPVFRAALQALQLPVGSQGLDVGCGLGFQTLLLADAVGEKGHVTGLDLSPALLDYAKETVTKSGLSERIAFREGDMNHLPFDDDTFDWAWSVDCVGYVPIEPLPPVKELARVVKPGSNVAILAWSSEKLLPGHPLLEAHLNATSAGIAPFNHERKPESHFLRALGWFCDAGLVETSARTFTGDVQAPLSDDLRHALLALFQMRWSDMESELSQQDWATYQRLCRTQSSDFILAQPDYYAFFTYSMFQGKLAQP